jgi:hypothetical protein
VVASPSSAFLKSFSLAARLLFCDVYAAFLVVDDCQQSRNFVGLSFLLCSFEATGVAADVTANQDISAAGFWYDFLFLQFEDHSSGKS